MLFYAMIAIVCLSVIPMIPAWAGPFANSTPSIENFYRITAGETVNMDVFTIDRNTYKVIVEVEKGNEVNPQGVVFSVSEGQIQPDNTCKRTVSVTISEPGEYIVYIKAYRGDPTDPSNIYETRTPHIIVSAAQHSITVTNDGHGTGTASPATAAATTPVTLNATPNNGYKLKEWQVISGNVAIANNSFVMPDNDVTVKAVFERSSTSDTHTHSYSWVVTKSPTATEDGEEAYMCSCGAVAQTRTLSSFSAFEDEIIEQIKNAPANGVVTIDMKTWNSLGKAVRDVLVARPDVTLKLSFRSEGYKGQRLKVTIPTGIDRSKLWDENGWLGLCRLGSTLGYDQ